MHGNRILTENTGRAIEELEGDMGRGNFISVEEVLEYGFMDVTILHQDTREIHQNVHTKDIRWFDKGKPYYYNTNKCKN